MPHACVTIIAGKDIPVCNNNTDAIVRVLAYPIARIAEKLNVPSLPADTKLPPGIWISDGSENGAAFNYIEIIDKMTERMSDAR